MRPRGVSSLAATVRCANGGWSGRVDPWRRTALARSATQAACDQRHSASRRKRRRAPASDCAGPGLRARRPDCGGGWGCSATRGRRHRGGRSSSGPGQVSHPAHRRQRWAPTSQNPTPARSRRSTMATTTATLHATLSSRNRMLAARPPACNDLRQDALPVAAAEWRPCRRGSERRLLGLGHGLPPALQPSPDPSTVFLSPRAWLVRCGSTSSPVSPDSPSRRWQSRIQVQHSHGHEFQ